MIMVTSSSSHWSSFIIVFDELDFQSFWLWILKPGLSWAWAEVSHSPSRSHMQSHAHSPSLTRVTLTVTVSLSCLSSGSAPVWLKRQTTANHQNHHTSPQTTTNHHQNLDDRQWNQIRCRQTTTNHCKPPPEFGMMVIRVLVKSDYFV